MDGNDIWAAHKEIERCKARLHRIECQQFDS